MAVLVCSLFILLAIACANGAPAVRGEPRLMYAWYGYVFDPVTPHANTHQRARGVVDLDSWSNCGNFKAFSSVSVEPGSQKGSAVKFGATVYLENELKGGTVDVEVYYRKSILVMKMSYDLCDLAKENYESCPIPAGERDIVFSQIMPKGVPSGKYTVRTEVANESGKVFACANITIKIPK